MPPFVEVASFFRYVAFVAGEYSVSVFIGDKEIVGSPFNTVLEPGLTAPSASLAYGASLTGALAGEHAQFYIQLRDKCCVGAVKCD